METAVNGRGRSSTPNRAPSSARLGLIRKGRHPRHCHRDSPVQSSTVMHPIPGQVNRTESEVIYPGGKGINVSISLQRLGQETRALGFAAGRIGQKPRHCHRDSPVQSSTVMHPVATTCWRMDT